MQNMFQVAFAVTGTLGANFVAVWAAPCDMKLLHVSAVGSNAHTGVLDIGPSTDTDGYLDGETFGVSGTPEEFGLAEFVGAAYPHIAKGTLITLTLDYNGDAGTAVHDFACVLTFAEG
jgi:hypothetical protein